MPEEFLNIKIAKVIRIGLILGLVLVFALTMVLPSNTYALSVKNKQGQATGVKRVQKTNKPDTLASNLSSSLDMNDEEGYPLIPYDMPAPTAPGADMSVVVAADDYGTTFKIALGYDRTNGGYGPERIWQCWEGQQCELKYSSDNTVTYDGGSNFKVRIQDLNHIWAFSGYGKILFSSDAGETWVVQKQASPTHDGWDEISAIQKVGDSFYVMDINGRVFKLNGSAWTQVANIQSLADLEINYWGGAVSMVPDLDDTTGNLMWILYKVFTKDTRVWSSHLATFNIANNSLAEISFPDPALEDVFVQGNCRSITTGTSGDYTIVSCDPAQFDYVSFLVRDSLGEWAHVIGPSAGTLNPRNITPSPYDSNIFYMMPGRGFGFYQYDAATETFTSIPVEYINDETPYVTNVIPRRGEIIICGWGGTNQFGKIMGAEAPALSFKNAESEYHAGDVIDIDLVMDASERDSWYVNVVRLMQIDGTDTYYSIPSGSDTNIDLTPFYIPDNDSVETNFFGAPLQLPAEMGFTANTCVTLYAAAVNPGKAVAEITPEDIIGNIPEAHFCLIPD